jgi:hypothetical protein
MSGAKLLIVGVDGLDYDVVLTLGPDLLPNLHPLVVASQPHSSTFPPDSVPSWMSIFTGEAPEIHGHLHSKNYLLDASEAIDASLSHAHDACFWTAAPTHARIAIVNPFLAYPAWDPAPNGAMVSAPSFDEGPAQVVDPKSLLTGAPPTRMGGFTNVPRQAELRSFAEDTFAIARDQFEYSLQQLTNRRWDIFFHTNLTVDRTQHFAWRHYDATDPTHPGRDLADLVPRAYVQLDAFLGAARSLGQPDDVIAVMSDHGHGQRASIGVNFNEIFRREGLHILTNSSFTRRAVETAKTATMYAAAQCHLDEPLIWVAKRMPGKTALKSGSIAGKASKGSLRVPDVAGSNPYGGIKTDGDEKLMLRAIEVMDGLRYKGQRVVRWCTAAEDVLPTGATGGVYPDLLFELEPRFGPTWNMYGPSFMPIVTHKRVSGGHTRRAVYASNRAPEHQPQNSVEVHHALRELCRSL